MEAAAECRPCFLEQALKTARLTLKGKARLEAVLRDAREFLRSAALDVPPPVLSEEIYRILLRHTGVADPYRALKDECIRRALEIYPALKARVESEPDPLRAAVRAAIAGNVIDFGVGSGFDLARDVETLFGQAPARDDYEDFRDLLARAREVLFLADNAGETVFDRILIEALGKPVIYAVRSGPIINDALREDAAASGIDRVARIVESGCRTPGTVLSRGTPEFLRIYRRAGLIISKGQGNYEALSREKRPIVFLLKVKCGVVARSLGSPQGSVVLVSQRRSGAGREIRG